MSAAGAPRAAPLSGVQRAGATLRGPAAGALEGRRVDAMVLGASAGGIEALGRLLPALRRGLPLPVLAVLHLPRDRPSLLSEIFTGKCALAVGEAEDKEPLRGGHLYFAPPDYHLLVDSGPRVALSVDDPVCFSRPSIDVLFESAADAYGRHLLAIVLTGGNEDGAAGGAAVRAADGMLVVQDPASAYMPLMPESALRVAGADFVGSLDAIAQLLRALE